MGRAARYLTVIIIFTFVSAVSYHTGAQVIINEIDSDTPGSDDAEFVELFDGGVGNADLDGQSAPI